MKGFLQKVEVIGIRKEPGKEVKRVKIDATDEEAIKEGDMKIYKAGIERRFKMNLKTWVARGKNE